MRGPWSDRLGAEPIRVFLSGTFGHRRDLPARRCLRRRQRQVFVALALQAISRPDRVPATPFRA